MNAALSNAERQARWRDNLKERADVIGGNSKEVAEKILLHLGKVKAQKVMRELNKRLRAIKPSCPSCKGTGYMEPTATTASQGKILCDCGGKKPRKE
jgi:hypothetical protein